MAATTAGPTVGRATGPVAASTEPLPGGGYSTVEVEHVTDDVLVPGARDVRASLSTPDGGADARADACVVACPPHPQHGGSRADGRLRAVADALTGRGVACLRFDYGPWDGGRGEVTDCSNALAWAGERYDRAGLFGYSFGAAVALVAAGVVVGGGDSAGGPAGPLEGPSPPCAVSVLAPPARLRERDVVDAVDGVDAPLQVCYGERDGTVDWEPVVEAARGRGADVVAFDGDHFFGGLGREVGEAVAGFLATECGPDG